MYLYDTRHHGCRADEFTWRGHRLIVMENECIRVSILASKGAEITEFRYKAMDLDVLWHTPQPVMPPGEYVPTRANPAGSFRDYYTGGWQEIFPNGGSDCEYRQAALGVHGEVALLPWDLRVVSDSARRVELEFSVQTVRTPFRLVRRMILESGSPRLRLEESVANLGSAGMHFMWGHHPVFGEPFLEPGCRIELPACSASVPAYGSALKRHFALNQASCDSSLLTEAGTREPWNIVPDRTRATEDVLLLSDFEAPWAALSNPRLGLAARIAWNASVFKYVWCWQHFAGNPGYPHYGRTYVVALEPFTSPAAALDTCVSQGACPQLEQGESMASFLEVEITNELFKG